ncbi:uncharacterized protein BXIN_2269 [Babesia sp. Xinjiang]|uniref:uncharacterized protein n=1 Tax=Babesia sp. Xinjiang TaxID=462227 RepID=UPI000A24A281|nr:uncharacterized protein BXIN_2269 [Babesia sp. Xinjiang]ORM40811.1 hypothetical protein BXIN_2269 [Babesia sp. Xinjiang]
MTEEKRKTQSADYLFWYLNCLLIGASVALFSAIMSFESYVLMRFLGEEHLTAQGLWYFLKRVHYVIAIGVFVLMIFTPLKRISLEHLGWALCATYALPAVYFYFCDEPLVSSWRSTCLFIAASVCSSALISAFFFFAFKLETHKNMMMPVRSVFMFILGTCLATYVPTIMVKKSTSGAKINLYNEQEVCGMLRTIFAIYTTITFLSAALTSLDPCSYLGISDTECLKQYSLGTNIIPEDMATTGIIFLCSIGWALSHICGSVTPFMFNLHLNESIWITNLQWYIFTAVTLFFLIWSFCRSFARDGCQQKNLGKSTMEAADAVDTVEPMTQVPDKEKLNSCIKTRILRAPQPWYLLPAGFWADWEYEDNDFHGCVAQCLKIANLLTSIRDGVNMDDGCNELEIEQVMTRNDMYNAKYHLLCLVANFVTKCEKTIEYLNEELTKRSCFKCPCKEFENKIRDFISKCGCVDNIERDLNFTTCSCERDHEDNTQGSSSTTTGNQNCSKNSSAASTCGSNTISSNICQMGCRLRDCIELANKLATKVRGSSSLCDDLDDSSLYYAADLLDDFLKEFIANWFLFCLVEECIAVFKYIDVVQKGVVKIIDHYTKQYKCRKGIIRERSKKDGSVCACVCLVKLVQCCQTLHAKQCGTIPRSNEEAIRGCQEAASLSHIRCLVLMVYSYIDLMDSKLASESGDCGSCHSQEDASACKCGNYNYRLYDILSRWLTDVSTSMSAGDKLLSDTIEMLSLVANNDDYVDVPAPEYVKILRSFVGIARKITLQANRLRGYQTMRSCSDADAKVDEEIMKTFSNTCPWCSSDCKQESCECLEKKLDEFKELEECSMAILCALSNLKDVGVVEKLPDCCNKISTSLEQLSIKLETVCGKTASQIKCLSSIGCEVSDFFTSCIKQPTCSSNASDNAFCNVDDVNKELVKLLFYSCSMPSGDSKECVSTSQPQECSQKDCKSMSCILRDLMCTIYGSGKEVTGQCQCKEQEKTECCTHGKGLCAILQECSCQLTELQSILGCPGGLAEKLNQLCSTVAAVSEEMTSINCCLDSLKCDYQNFDCYLTEVQDCLQQKFEAEKNSICELQKFLDDNGEACRSAIESMTDILKATSELSEHHQKSVFFLDTEVRKLTDNVNKTCERAQGLNDALVKCLEGFDAEKRSMLVPPRRERSGYRKARKYSMMATISDYMWHFDLLWSFGFLFCAIHSWYNSQSNNWLYVTSRNFAVLVAAKGVMMVNIYVLGLCSRKGNPDYFINYSLLLGFFIALCMSWASQWWAQAVFIREHSRPVSQWFRVLYPDYVHGAIGGAYQWYAGICGIIGGDLMYLGRFIFRNDLSWYRYNPFGSMFDSYFRMDSRPLYFHGVCHWNSFENKLRSDILTSTMVGDYSGLVNYLAFKSSYLKDLGFLFNTSVSNVGNVPIDLLWSAWHKMQVLTLERCVSYSILEAAYINVYNMIKRLNVGIKAAEEAGESLLEMFDREQRNDIVHKAMMVPEFTEINVKGRQMSSLYKVFTDYYMMKWDDHCAKRAYRSKDSAEKSLHRPSGVEPNVKLRICELRNYLRAWSQARLEACEIIYGGDEACVKLVSSAVTMVRKYISTIEMDAVPRPAAELLRFCENYRATNSGGTPGADSKAKGTNNIAKKGSDVSQQLVETGKGSQNRHMQEMPDMDRFFLGFWLKYAAIGLRASDVERALSAKLYNTPSY